MPLPKDKNHIDDEELNNVLQTARKANDEMLGRFGHRATSFNTESDEIIACKTSQLRLAIRSFAECSRVMNTAQGYIERINEIELNSIKVQATLEATYNAIKNSILAVLGSAGSADSRIARAEGAMMNIVFLLDLEKGLQRICKSARETIDDAASNASRAQTGLEYELKYLDPRIVSQETLDAIKAVENEQKPQWK